MNSLHKTVPALRRHDVNTATIRQHYYPEGGWGWIVCACGFLVHVFTTGLQFSYGVLYLEAVKIHGPDSAMDAGNKPTPNVSFAFATLSVVLFVFCVCFVAEQNALGRCSKRSFTFFVETCNTFCQQIALCLCIRKVLKAEEWQNLLQLIFTFIFFCLTRDNNDQIIFLFG